MKFVPALAKGLSVTAASLLLVGCISLLPKQKPALLYRFGADPAPISSAAPVQARLAVRNAEIGFERAAAGDRILTVTGDTTAYIAGARWVSPAVFLFDAAVTHAFDVHGGAARLVARGEAARAAYSLKLDVRAFEVRYDHGPAAAPTIVVQVYGALSGFTEATPARERLFEARVAAADNRVGAIVPAFDQAVNTVLGELIAWIGAKGAS